MELQPHLDISPGKLEEIYGTTVDGNVKEHLLIKMVFILLPPFFSRAFSKNGKGRCLTQIDLRAHLAIHFFLLTTKKVNIGRKS